MSAVESDPFLVVEMVVGGGIKPPHEVSFQAADGYSKDEWKTVSQNGYDGWDINDDYDAGQYPPSMYANGTVVGTVTFDARDDDNPTFEYDVDPKPMNPGEEL